MTRDPEERVIVAPNTVAGTPLAAAPGPVPGATGGVPFLAEIVSGDPLDGSSDPEVPDPDAEPAWNDNSHAHGRSILD